MSDSAPSEQPPQPAPRAAWSCAVCLFSYRYEDPRAIVWTIDERPQLICWACVGEIQTAIKRGLIESGEQRPQVTEEGM